MPCTVQHTTADQWSTMIGQKLQDLFPSMKYKYHILLIFLCVFFFQKPHHAEITDSPRSTALGMVVTSWVKLHILLAFLHALWPNYVVITGSHLIMHWAWSVLMGDLLECHMALKTPHIRLHYHLGCLLSKPRPTKNVNRCTRVLALPSMPMKISEVK